MVKILFAASVSFSLFIGCIASSSFNPAVKEEHKFQKPDSLKSLQLKIKYEFTMNGSVRNANPNAEQNAKDQVLNTVRESGLFKEVKTELDEPDLKLTVKMEDRGKGNEILPIISGLLLILIPFNVQDDFHFEYKFKNMKTKAVKEYKRQVTFDVWFHLFLAPVTPFKFLPSVTKDGFKRTTESVLEEAVNDGVLK